MNIRLLTILFLVVAVTAGMLIFIPKFLNSKESNAQKHLQNEAKQGIKQEGKQTKVIGIVLPMDHAALREIVSGFQETLKELSEYPLEFKIQNAQGDMNVQRGIIQQFVNQKVDLVVPVTTISAQMALTLVKDQPMVSLAARINLADYQTKPSQAKDKTGGSVVNASTNQPRITGVVDEFGPERPLDLVIQVIPGVKKITLVHSNSEKIFPEIEALVKHAESKNIKVQKLMIQNLADLYTTSQLIDSDSQLICMLKDSLVASGIKTLIQQGRKKQIPVITMDEGTVGEGATFALGVKERMVGEQGARLANQILQGVDIRTLPIETLEKLSVFYNEEACLQQGIDLDALKKAAEQHGYELVRIQRNGERNGVKS